MRATSSLHTQLCVCKAREMGRRARIEITLAALHVDPGWRAAPAYKGSLSCHARIHQISPGSEAHPQRAPMTGSAVVLHRERAKAEARHRRVHAQPAQVLKCAPAGRSGGLRAMSGRQAPGQASGGTTQPGQTLERMQVGRSTHGRAVMGLLQQSIVPAPLSQAPPAE